MKTRAMWVVVLGVALATGAAAQQFVYPAKGQSPQQQAAAAQQQAAFAKARAAYLEGRGYSVK